MNYIVTAISYYIGGKPTCCNNGFRFTELFCKRSSIPSIISAVPKMMPDCKHSIVLVAQACGGEASENDGKREACPESAFIEISTPGAIVPP